MPLFILNAIVFIPLGQIVGGYLEIAPRGILAYSINILGSLAGFLLFTLLCQYWQPPLVWFSVAGALLTLLVGKVTRLRWTTLAAFGLCLALFYLRPHGIGRQYWSPYQYLELSARVENGEVIAYQLDTNHTWFQQIVNLSPAFVLGIGVCMFASYVLPLERFFSQAFWIKALVATLVLCSPVAFASIVFVRSFADYNFSGQALGSNLLGALVGGKLESVSLWTGIRSLLIFATILYFLSFLFLRRRKGRSAELFHSEPSQEPA